MFVEIGPDGTLSALGPAALAEAADGGEARCSSRCCGRASRARRRCWPRWPGLTCAGWRWTGRRCWAGGRRVELPTYAFQRQRYWPGPRRAGGDAAALGLGAVGHPLLGAAVELAGGGGCVFTGRLSVRSQPWLADHVVAGRVLVPGTALVEMAVRAGDAAGCGLVEELVLEAPLVLPGRGRGSAAGRWWRPGESGRRAVQVYARPGDAAAEVPWTRHASGLLAPAAEPGAGLAG